MVNLFAQIPILLADETKQTALERLDPDRRAAVILALVGLSLLGVLLIVIVMLGARWARQRRPQRPKRAGRQSDVTLDTYPQRPRVRGGEFRSDETIVNRPGDGETKA
ncbi:hypothetical protein NG895_04045 [Aeoliella sp. ICT_H6.2]|uniref:Uncharacterized protein n=1 Tax=Aeoliella straminimaris TaxID=2954799 RepID=A0A9X2F7F0_9BACT|nr:hypothetical protein [Aeoliella straminimaris]MCO6043068.1 hypothetical protein [Aeoliella straminimaris]